MLSSTSTVTVSTRRRGPLVDCRRSVLPPTPPPKKKKSSSWDWEERSNDRNGSQHMASITELDLSACHPNTIADRISAVPGLKTSTAFFTFLRANLVLPPSAMSSNVSTPNLEPQSHTLPPPSPSPLATNPPLTAVDEAATSGANNNGNADAAAVDGANGARRNMDGGANVADADIPPLTLGVLSRQEDKVEALRLVADSIAQQRQVASLHLVFHPLLLAGLAAGLAGAWQFSASRSGELGWGLAMSMCSGVVMAYLLGIRYFASEYITIAEGMRWEWLLRTDEDAGGSGGGGAAATGEEDLVIGTRFGDEMIGALVLRLLPNPSSGLAAGKKKSRSLGLKGGRGVIRAWTTRLRYRRKGVGTDMLQEAVRVTREKCGKDAEIGFAKEHANSVMVLPEMFNTPFRKQEVKAAKALEKVLGEWEGNKRKR